MTNLFNRVKEAVENAIDNGYEPLAMSARDLAEDLQAKAADFAEDAVEDIQEAAAEVKKLFSKTND
jgi:ribosome-binding protein aMBF1 (putative translation factor)